MVSLMVRLRSQSHPQVKSVRNFSHTHGWPCVVMRIIDCAIHLFILSFGFHFHKATIHLLFVDVLTLQHSYHILIAVMIVVTIIPYHTLLLIISISWSRVSYDCITATHSIMASISSSSPAVAPVVAAEFTAAQLKNIQFQEAKKVFPAHPWHDLGRGLCIYHDQHAIAVTDSVWTQ